MSQVVHVVAEFEVQTEAVGEFIELATQLLVTPTLSEPGCLRYELCQNVEAPHNLAMLETWESKATLDEHLAQASLNVALDQLRPYVINGPTVTVYRQPMSLSE